MSRRLPPLNALRAFEAAARHGGFTRAAEELGVTPAAVSHQVKGLEDVLGLCLFRRLPRGLELTEEGQAYLPDLSRGFDRLARAGERLREGGLAGRLTVSVLPSFCANWLAPRLPDFQAACPEVHLRMLSENRFADFNRDGIDMAIRYGRGIYPGLRAIPFLAEEVFPVCAPSLLNGALPLRGLADLRHHTLLRSIDETAGEPWLYWRLWLAAEGIEGVAPDGGIGFTDGSALVQACLAGVGVALGRTALVEDHLRTGRLVRPFAGLSRPADFSYFAVAPAANLENPRVACFIDWLRAAGVPACLADGG
ncbi:transcriptional regulator GcvA [Rhodospirillum rubrum]|uniref:Transcriptional regulator, LysR family n=1 Tax=Rhodospirillum rubrum (strain ATCC 11170 / ATH 1.1.1 / DSM 467 / LMG 4362 / NCIMB 8255 / S1) TaxID=269796 RepID=Q2RS81_RHORT|nr:transcriptional regulator GcvA [Rhodospirillum rubrum]ABC23014.1 transcriptional regulator, LysR family [Rhodospirillum rubrum ATCC 11170]AEO48743.1 LysR family transcriptional regulator [Rhodospirillum rubrum F11]MBK5954637.1 LysR family transcriptional regulator [Rhodospirillum rubrum]QXG78998.1 transcriptional regulator GcvA [Rhodospirillum rubrum]HCF17324.1 transcriptional regulator GcvA [Rhodospirillum rubrum]